MVRSRLLCLLAMVGFVACNDDVPGVPPPPVEKSAPPLWVYCGRPEKEMAPLLEEIAEELGVTLRVDYGDGPTLANVIIEAAAAKQPLPSVFVSAGASPLGMLTKSNLLMPLPPDVIERVAPSYRSPEAYWVGLMARVRAVAYNANKVQTTELPASLEAFESKVWEGRVGWVPDNETQHDQITALRLLKGADAAERWLLRLNGNKAKRFRSNVALVTAVARGEVHVGITDHDALHLLQAGGRAMHVRNAFPAGAASLLNLSGVGVLRAKDPSRALALVRALLQADTQTQWAAASFEYPLAKGARAPNGLPPLASIDTPTLDPARLRDVGITVDLIRRTGVLH